MAGEEFTPESPAYYFNLAIEEYADLHLFFYLDRCEYSHVTALCVGIKKGYFIASVPLDQLNEHPVIWGSEVSGYFTVRDPNFMPCHFKTRLARLYNAPPNSLYMVFPLPPSLDHNQRRFSRRVSVDSETTEKFRVWLGDLEGGNDESLPRLRWLALEPRYCDIAEISANGLRLDFPPNSPILAKININDPVLLKGDFGQPRKPLLLFVQGNVVRVMPKLESEDGIISVGCHFRAWRKVVDEKAQTWFRADTQEGVGAIAQWISRNFRFM